jgi:acyl dehydratase
MPGYKLTISALKAGPGLELPTITYQVGEKDIRNFCQAVGDDNPRWIKEVPSTFVLTLGFNQILTLLDNEPPPTVLHASTDLEVLASITVGDVLTVRTTVSRVREINGRYFATFDLKSSNQKGEVVSYCRQTAVIY